MCCQSDEGGQTSCIRQRPTLDSTNSLENLKGASKIIAREVHDDMGRLNDGWAGRDSVGGRRGHSEVQSFSWEVQPTGWFFLYSGSISTRTNWYILSIGTFLILFLTVALPWALHPLFRLYPRSTK